MEDRELLNSLQNAFDAAYIARPKKTNRQLSTDWVEQVAKQFRNVYKKGDGYRVFSKGYPNNQEFGMNELLYDVSVCEARWCRAPRQKKSLHYVSKPIWAIESEFAKNGREALYDFNKLVMSSATNKLFIGPFVADCKRYLDVMRHAALCCTDNVFFAFACHPKEWNGPQPPQDVQLWKLVSGRWREVN